MSHAPISDHSRPAGPRPAALLALAAAAIVLALSLLTRPTQAEGDGGTKPDDAGLLAPDAGAGSLEDGSADAAEQDPAVLELVAQAAQVRAFLRGELDTAVDPSTLFNVALHDEAAIAIEAKRLAAIVERVDKLAADAGVDAGPTKKQPKPAKTKKPAIADAGGADGPDADADAGADPRTIMAYDALRSEDPARWKARVDLDRARLAFYGLPKESRDSLIARHVERQKADAESKGKLQLSAAERKAKLAEEERQNALEAARNARTEATRIVAEEHARLLGVAKQQAEFEAKLVQDRTALEQRNEAALTWRRKVSEITTASTRGESASDAADVQYRSLRVTLNDARNQLDEALAAWSSGESLVPAAGADALETVPAEVDRSKAENTRAKVQKVAARLQQEEATFRQARALQLLEEIESLNRLRLSLLPYLSDAKRREVTGFNAPGRDQAVAETRQVSLVMRYHWLAATSWLSGLREGATRGQSLLTAFWLLLKWTLPVAAFVWWRKRADRVLRELRTKVRDNDKKSGRMDPSLLDRTLSFTLRVRAPLEWLLLSWAAVWMLPGAGANLLEVELLTTIFRWTLGGQLVVHAVDAIASDEVRKQRSFGSAKENSLIRFRSLRLIGVTVVGFGLVLSLSNQLVGKGTVYEWVFATSWFAAIPILLVIVKWWRPVIFERMERVRKKRALETWIISKKKGAASFVAAMVGGAYLVITGVARVARGWAGTFTITRRVLAYWFRRGMNKKADEAAPLKYKPVDVATFHRLGPGTPSPKNVPSVADVQVEEVIERIKAPGGGIFAIVGERGAGKTALATRIADKFDELTMVSCPRGGLAAFRPILNRGVGLDESATAEDAAKKLDSKEVDSAVLIDDAHHLIRPMVGGLSDFDQLLDLARQHSNNCTWIFAIDEVLWRLVERARGARPLFDDVIRLKPWSEEGILRLLTNRNTIVGIDPSFEHLLDARATAGDELDRQDALARTSANYYRLLWDYSSGNPGVALHFWRSSLGIDPAGTLCARHFRAPDAADLEQLPDTAVFVLRAIVQLDWALPEDISRATSLSASQVQDALRYGTVKGYFDVEDGQYRVTWTWFRAITRMLYRRHLIFSGS